jgi:hypothetical protein
MSADALQAWLSREARRSERSVSLDDALLTDRGLRYSAYRLRYALPRGLLRTGLHVLELVAITSMFRFEYVAPLIAVRSATAVIGAFWWGTLEGLRVRVRDSVARREYHEATLACQAWLSYSIDFGLVLLAALLCWLRFGPRPFAGFSIFDAFAIACGVRLFIEGVARTYHSGVFALKRVYRPLASVLLPDVLEVAALLVLLPLLGLWSLSVVALAGGIVRVLLTLHYSRRAYATTRLSPPRWLGLGRARKRLPLRRELRALWDGAANLSSRVDAVLVIGLLAGSRGASLMLAAAFYLLQPLLAAGQRWAGFFYLDFLTLRARHAPFFERRFERLLIRSALWFALLTAAVAALCVLWLRSDFPKPLLALLAAFIVLRSFLGLYQVQAFALHQHRYLIKLSLAALGAIGVAVLGFGDGPLGLPVLLGSFTLVLLLLRPPRATSERPLEHCPDLLLPAWLSALQRESARGELWVMAAAVDRRSGVTRPRVARALAALVGHGAFSRIGRQHLLAFGRGAADAQLRAALIVGAGGALAKLELRPAADVRELLKRFVPELLEPLDGGAEALRQRFRQSFPDGQVLSVDGGALRKLDRASLRAVAAEIQGRAPRALKRRAALEVAVYAPRGEPELVFAMPRDTAASERLDFRRLVERASLSATLQ